MSLIGRDRCPTLISARDKRLSCIKNRRKMCLFCQKDLLLRTSNRCVFQKKSDDHAAPLSEWLLFAFLYTLSKRSTGHPTSHYRRRQRGLRPVYRHHLPFHN